MTKVFTNLGAIGALLLGMVAGGVCTGCGSSKPGGPTGTGGAAVQDAGSLGAGGALGSGGTPASGGTTETGLGGTASGGMGAGGITSSGAGGKGVGGTDSGGIGSGGITSVDAGDCLDGTCPKDASPVDAGSGDIPNATCSQLATQAACDVRSDCHSVFVDPGNCACLAVGCCTRFDRCADGGKANCMGPALCKSATPYCESPSYVLSYTGSCYEGCVRPSECPTPTCPQAPPTNASACGSVDFSCFYEDCNGAGRTQANCSGNTWQVQTGACTSVTCTGVGPTTTLTCVPGQFCVLTTSGGGAHIVQPSCVDNTCGQGPISPQCVHGLSASCSGRYFLSGVEFDCSLPSSCGQGQGGCA